MGGRIAGFRRYLQPEANDESRVPESGAGGSETSRDRLSKKEPMDLKRKPPNQHMTAAGGAAIISAAGTVFPFNAANVPDTTGGESSNASLESCVQDKDRQGEQSHPSRSEHYEQEE